MVTTTDGCVTRSTSTTRRAIRHSASTANPFCRRPPAKPLLLVQLLLRMSHCSLHTKSSSFAKNPQSVVITYREYHAIRCSVHVCLICCLIRANGWICPSRHRMCCDGYSADWITLKDLWWHPKIGPTIRAAIRCISMGPGHFGTTSCTFVVIRNFCNFQAARYTLKKIWIWSQYVIIKHMYVDLLYFICIAFYAPQIATTIFFIYIAWACRINRTTCPNRTFSGLYIPSASLYVSNMSAHCEA